MLLKVCSVCSARSSLTTLPVFGSKPPWPDRKIHSPTVSPGEYGPGAAGTLSELMRAFMDVGLLEVWVRHFRVSLHTGRYTSHHTRHRRSRRGASPALTPSMSTPSI